MKYFLGKLNYWFLLMIFFTSCAKDISNEYYTIKYLDVQFEEYKDMYNGIMYIDLELINKRGALYPPDFWNCKLQTIPGHIIFKPREVIHRLITENEGEEIKEIYRLKFNTISSEFYLAIPEFPIMYVNVDKNISRRK